MRSKNNISSFNLSFLDIMFCGFGAVVLLVLIINANTISSRKEHHEDLRAEVIRIEKEIKIGQDHLVELKNSLDIENQQIVTAQGRSNEVLVLITRVKEELADFRNQTIASKQHINQLESDLKSLDLEHKRLGSELKANQEQGKKVRRFEGEGNRQYLTGLKLGGKRVLILVDASASMLDKTIVNVIRRRNSDDETKRKSPKWQQARKTVEWLIANLPPESTLQVYGFNTQPFSLLSGNMSNWTPATDTKAVGELIAKLNKTVPGNGTSLVNAFSIVKSLRPRPDNILLITDGLPTQGRKRPSNNTVSGKQRIKYFEQAIKTLPSRIPVNTLLFPMEGDPMAAVAYWRLAVDTGGSFLTPSSDWP
jgi:hypothetical protein